MMRFRPGTKKWKPILDPKHDLSVLSKLVLYNIEKVINKFSNRYFQNYCFIIFNSEQRGIGRQNFWISFEFEINKIQTAI